MARLPTPGSDNGRWGTILNDFLNQAHAADGSLKDTGVVASKAADATVVHNTGDETIAGVKTFSSSPVVPTPSSNTQAANKAYVDSAAGVTTAANVTNAPAGTIAATNVQAAINELDTEKIALAAIGASSGVAGLDSSGHIPRAQRPDLDTYNVKDYGAVGDGTTDDTAAINSVLALLNNSTDFVNGANKAVFFPKGRYRITSTLATGNSLSFVNIYGQGPHSSVLVWDGGNSEMLKLVNARGVQIYGMGLQGHTTSSKRPTYGVRIHRGAGLVGGTSPTAVAMTDCWLGSTGTDSMSVAIGFTAEAGFDQNNDMATFRNVDILNVQTGYWFSHVNTLWHNIIGGLVSKCSVACIDNTPDAGFTTGGNYNVFGTNFFTGPTTGTIFRVGPHAGVNTIAIYGMNAESSVKLIDTPATLTNSYNGMQFFGGHAGISDQTAPAAAITWDSTAANLTFHSFSLSSPSGARLSFPSNGCKVSFHGGHLVMKEFSYNCEIMAVGTRITGGSVAYTDLGQGAFYQFATTSGAVNTGAATATSFNALGLSGATQASRYVGGTTSGAPASGTFAVGDFVVARDGYIWQCTAAGTPGTWVRQGQRQSSSQTTATLGTTLVTNGDFATDLSSWSGANWSWSSATALHTTGSTAALTQALTGLASGSYYLISWTMTGRTAGSVVFALDAVVTGSKTASGTDTLIAASTTPSFTITPTTDFDGAIDSVSVQVIGTSSAQVFLDSTPGTAVGELRASTNNIGLGLNALSQNVSGTTNVAVGPLAMQRNTSGNANTAVGYASLRANTTGGSNLAVGTSAATALTTATGNTAVGANALVTATTGNYNTAVGNGALAAITTATGLAIGELCLGSVTTGANNTAVGRRAGWSPAGVTANATTTGSRQTLLGNMTGQASTTQRNDVVAIGDSALIDGDHAIAIGSGVSAGAAGAVAIGRSSAGTPASTTTANEFKFGTASHTYNFPGSAWTIADAANLNLGTTTGTKIAATSTQKLGLWGATPIVQPTTSVTGANVVTNAGTAVNDATTYDGYTMAQVVKALRNAGILA